MIRSVHLWSTWDTPCAVSCWKYCFVFLGHLCVTYHKWSVLPFWIGSCQKIGTKRSDSVQFRFHGLFKNCSNFYIDAIIMSVWRKSRKKPQEHCSLCLSCSFYWGFRMFVCLTCICKFLKIFSFVVVNKLRTGMLLFFPDTEIRSGAGSSKAIQIPWDLRWEEIDLRRPQ